MFALVDENSFYASCQTVFRPDLKDKPVCVLSNNDGCVIACSQAARALGIKMGTPWFRLNTKGKRERVVCYGPAITPVLAAHLRCLRQTGITGGALFRSVSDRNYGSPLSYWSWSKTVCEWSYKTEMPYLTTHTFRHLRLTHLARAGWKLHEIATYAGHRDLRTTQIYIHLSGTYLAARMATTVAETDRKIAAIMFDLEKNDDRQA